MPFELPSRPNLERLRRMAKDLLKLVRSADGPSLRRMRVYFANATAASVQLAQVQTTLAREHEFASWPALVAAVELRNARLKAKAERALTRWQAGAAELAALWFTLAEAGDLDTLWQKMGVGKRRSDAARAIMLKDRARYDRLVETIIAGLAHPNGRARFEYAHILDSFGDARSVEPLKALMNDPVPRVRWMAMHALTCHDCGDESCPDDPELIAEIARRAKTDPSPKVRQHATVALGLSGYRPIEPVVRDILATATDERIVRAAKFSLKALSAEASATPS